MKLTELKKKRAKRVESRKHHFHEWERFKKQRRMGRAKWHLEEFEKDIRAIKKLDKLIEKAEKEQKSKKNIDWNGHAPVGGPNLRKAIRFALNNYDVYITSTNGGSHTIGSLHYSNDAVDLGANTQQAKDRCHKGLLKEFGAKFFTELFGPVNNCFVDNGIRYTAGEGTGNESLHDNHIHLGKDS